MKKEMKKKNANSMKNEEKMEVKEKFNKKLESKEKNVFCKTVDNLKNYSIYITLLSLIVSIILLVIVIIDKPKVDLLYSFLGPQIKEVQEQKELAGKYNETVKNFKTITAEEVAKKYKEDKLVFVYYGRSGCHYCVKYAPIVKEVAKEKKVEFNYFNADQLTQEGAEKIIALNSEFNNGLRGTPFTFAFKNGKLLGSFSGYVEKEQLSKFIDTVKEKK